MTAAVGQKLGVSTKHGALLGGSLLTPRPAQEMNGMCGGTTHPRMTTEPTLILGAMARAVTTAEHSTLLKFGRIPFAST